ncbi:MAG: hypothetical protein AB1758_26865, partial [Candidatus Eremiobacterota bacterium]
MRRRLAFTLAALFLAAAPAQAGLADIQFEVLYDCSVSPGAQGATTVRLPNGGTQLVPVPGLQGATVYLTATTHRLGIVLLSHQVHGSQTVQYLSSPQMVIVMGQGPAEFCFVHGKQRVTLRTRSCRVNTPGVPTLEDPGSPYDPLGIPGLTPVPMPQLPESPTVAPPDM